MTCSFIASSTMALFFLFLAILILPITPKSSVVPYLSFQHQPRKTALQKGFHTLFKRGSSNKFSGRATFYATGLGACGVTNTDSDFIVALNQPQYEANKWCGKTITITYGGKSHDATIQDECPGCPQGGLDMSPALFKYFASEDAGVFYMSWTLSDGSGSGGSSQSPSGGSSPAPPASTYTPPVYQTPAYEAPAATSSPAPTYTQGASENTPSPSPVASASASSWASTPTPPSVPASKAAGNTLAPPKTNTPTTTNNDNSPAIAKGYALSSSNYGQVESSSAYEVGGNLDTLSQLVMAFGSLAAASASYAISNGND